jgi:hypothetical protein
LSRADGIANCQQIPARGTWHLLAEELLIGSKPLTAATRDNNRHGKNPSFKR